MSADDNVDDSVSEGHKVGFSGMAMNLTVHMFSGRKDEAQVLLEQILREFPELAKEHGYNRDTIDDWDKEAEPTDLTIETEEVKAEGDNNRQ